MARRSLVPRDGLIWATLFAIAVAMLVASTIAAVIRSYTPVPKWDSWGEIIWLKNYYSGQWHVSDLWRQQLEPRPLFPRIFFLIDWFLFGGKNIFLLSSMLFLQAGHAWIFIHDVRRWPGFSGEVRLTVGAVVAALFLSGAQLEYLSWPYGILVILALYAGTISIRSLIVYAEQTRLRTATGWLGVCIGSAIVATYSFSSGILLWPVLFLTAASLRLRQGILLLIAGFAGAVSLLYFTGYHLVSGYTSTLQALQEPVHVLAYVCAYLALPLSRINHDVGVAVGFVVLIGVIWETYQMFRRPALPRLIRLDISVMIFITTGAFAIPLARMTLTPPEAALRYATPVCIFWACALPVLMTEARFLWERTEIGTVATLTAAITCLVVVILPLHLDQSAFVVHVRQTLRDSETALMANVPAKEELSRLFPDPILLSELSGVLRDHQKSLFAAPPLGMGEPLRSHYRIVASDRCSGIWESTTMIENSGSSGESASGWAWDSARNQPPKMILIADDSGIIRGLGQFTRNRQDVAVALRNSTMKSSGWFGFVSGAPGSSLRAYALLSDGRSLCSLRNSTEVSSSVLVVFRHGTWIVDSNKSGSWEPGDRTFKFGLDGDFPVAGDWDGSGVIRAGGFRNGKWFLDWNNSGRWDEGDRQISFGLPGDLPVVGDWNNTGVTKVGVFRDGTWHLDWSGEQRYSSHTRQFQFGLPGDIPVAGDWDNSGKIRIGVYRRGTWYLDVIGEFGFTGHEKVVQFGLPDDQPVVGDWNGLGATRIGVFRNGLWIVDSNGNFQLDADDRTFSFGGPGDNAVLFR